MRYDHHVYHRQSIRLRQYDYSQAGYYYVTICTHERTEWFGKIKNGEMALNQYGTIAKQQWEWLQTQYPYVELDKFVVMPNHFHGIIGIDVGAGRDLPLHKIKPLPELIGAFKTTSSKLIHIADLVDFHWQRNYYDHVIRDEISLRKIREYIIANPAMWDSDEENPANLQCV